MADASQAQTARIYAFPDRATLRGRSRPAVGGPARAPTEAPRVTVGAWYHDEAVREAAEAKR